APRPWSAPAAASSTVGSGAASSSRGGTTSSAPTFETVPCSSLMSAVASIDAAADGELPAWAVVSAPRRDHIRRVATLMDAWAARLGLDAEERRRWRAAAWLHDALRDAAPDDLRPGVPEWARELPGPILHGPAVAARLEAEGAADRELLDAVAYHTLGHP